MPKREITPYKGGRTKRIPIRVTPKTYRRAHKLAKLAGFDSLADWFDEMVNEAYEAQTGGGEDDTRTS